MAFYVGTRLFKILVCSDVQREGLGVELWDEDSNELLIEIFRNDAKKEITFFADARDTPFEAVEAVLRAFETDVGRMFQDE